LSLIGSRQVQLQELAVVFNHEVKEESDERRLQAFFKDYVAFKKVIALLGKNRIGAVITDRELVGKDGIDYLLKERIPFFLRLPKHYWFMVNGVELKAKNLIWQGMQIG
jgi:hypothetical protein